MALQTRGDGVSIPAGNKVVLSTSIDVFDNLGVSIGFIQTLTRRDDRPTQLIRHLDSTDAGRMIEQAPGPETNRLDVTGFALYNVGPNKKSLLNRVAPNGGAFRSLNSQHIPFEIEERTTHPATPTLQASTLYGDCYLISYSRPVNIGTVHITETATLQATWLE